MQHNSIREMRTRPARAGEVAVAALLPLLVAQDSIVAIVAAVGGLLALPAQVGSVAVYGVMAWAVAVAFRTLLARAATQMVGLGIALFAAFAFSMLIGRAPTDFYITIAAGCLVGLGWLTVALSISDFRRSRRYLYAAAPAILLAVAIEMWSAQDTVLADASYSQSLGYKALAPVLLFTDAAFRGNRIVNGGLALVSGLLMIGAGARGPLVAAGVFVLARFVIHLRHSPRVALIAAWIGASATWLLAQFHGNVLIVLLPTLERLGLSTRAVTVLVDGEVFEDRARTMLKDQAIEIVNRYPLTGVGMSNERPLLAQAMGASVETQALGWYPHNIFLEFWAQFGVIFGTLLMALLLRAILRVLVDSEEGDRRDLALIFVGLGLLPLLFSGSYLSWPPFFSLLGLCLQRPTARIRDFRASDSCHVAPR